MSAVVKAHFGPVAMQVKRQQEGQDSAPTSSSMCHSEPCDGRWQGRGATKPTTESGGEKEGVSSGH